MGKKRNKKILRLREKPKPKSGTMPSGEKRNWLELPQDVTVSILSRLRAIDILDSAQKVCTAWRSLCKDPIMWRTIDMRNDGTSDDIRYDLDRMCRHAVDRSSGNLLDINVEYFGSDYLLQYVTNSCRGIRRLRLACCRITDKGLIAAAANLPLLEELEMSFCYGFSRTSVEAVGRCCPLLKSFKLNRNRSHDMFGYFHEDYDDYFHEDYDDYFHEYYDDQFDDYFPEDHDDHFQGYHENENDNEHGPSRMRDCVKDCDACAVADTMHGLHHLQLVGNELTNDGLRKILDCCPHLESLDLRLCLNLNLKGDLGKRCDERIKKLQLPNDPVGGDDEFPAEALRVFNNDSGDDYDDYDCGDYEDFDYDDFTKIGFSDLF